MKADTFFVLLLFCLLPLPVLAVSNVHLSTGEWKPYISEQYPDLGALSVIVTKAFEAEGIEVKHSFYPWKRALYLSQKGLLDGTVAIAKTREREQDYWYSDEPLLIGERVFFHLKQRPFDWQTIDDLDGMRVGGTLGYHYGAPFQQSEKTGHIIVERVTQDVQNFRKLLAHRIQTFPITKEVGYFIMRTELDSFEAEKLTHHPVPLTTTPFYLILSKRIPENRARMAAFNRGFKKLQQSGQYQQILEQIK
jgi:polar amino acid transport system substrate-binding protein